MIFSYIVSVQEIEGGALSVGHAVQYNDNNWFVFLGYSEAQLF